MNQTTPARYGAGLLFAVALAGGLIGSAATFAATVLVTPAKGADGHVGPQGPAGPAGPPGPKGDSASRLSGALVISPVRVGCPGDTLSMGRHAEIVTVDGGSYRVCTVP